MSPDLLLYVLTDTSGSTVRRSFNAGWNDAIPRLLQSLERLAGPDARISFLTYGDDAVVRGALQPVADVESVTVIRPQGLSSLAAGFRLLTTTVAGDCAQLEADGIEFAAPVVLVVADGLPTDDDGELLEARAGLADLPHPVEVRAAVPAGTDRLAVAALADHRHDLELGSVRSVSDSLTSAWEQVLAEKVQVNGSAAP